MSFEMLERGLLSAGRRIRSSMAELDASLDEYEFADPCHQWVWEKMAAAWKHGELASLAYLVAQVDFEPEEAQAPILESLKLLHLTSPTPSFNTDLDTIRRLIRRGKLAHGVESAVKSMDGGDLDAAADAMTKYSASAPSSVHARSLIEWDRWIPSPEDMGILTGITTLDERSRGARPGDLGVIFGCTGLGKSILGVNLGHAGVVYKKKILHVDTENGEDMVRWRYVSRILGIPYSILANNMMMPEQREMLDSWARAQKERLDAHLRILHIGVDRLTFRQLVGEVDRLRRGGFDPDEIIVDSPDHFILPDKDNIALVLGQLYMAMKGWGQSISAAVWALTQAKMEAEGKIATAGKIKWSSDKSANADFMLSINPGFDGSGRVLSDTAMGGERMLYVAKARSSQARYTISLDTDLDRCLIKERRVVRES